MSLSRKHYCAVAAIIADKLVMLPPGVSSEFDLGRAALRSISHELADMFASDNPAFDRARFLAACKVQS